MRWEQLSVQVQELRLQGSGLHGLAAWGNEICCGAPFAAGGQGPFAGSRGRRRGRARLGQPRAACARNVSTRPCSRRLPVGALSQIIEDDDGMHIVRVLEREDAKRSTPFTEVQARDQESADTTATRTGQRNEYIAKLRETTPRADDLR